MFTPESSARVQTRSTSRREKGKTKAGESFEVKQTPKYDPHPQKRQRSTPATPSPAAISPTTTTIATTSSPSSSDKAEPSRQFRKRKAMRAPPVAAKLPRRVSTRKQCKVSPASPQPEVIIILKESVGSENNVSQNVSENVVHSPFVIPEEEQIETREVEHNERGVPSLDDLAVAVMHISEEA